ncbi:MAG: DUF2723 domain-containing protein [Syntrophothermus sp.]
MLLGIYLRTLAPGLTWLHHGSDGGDLIAATATGGIPHPTGYPLYLLLARVFQFLPVGSLAYRTNLMSAIFAMLASLLIYGIVVRHLPAGHGLLRGLAGMAAGFASGLAPLVWSQAVITEVYTLQAFLVAAIISVYSGSPSLLKARDGWRGLVLALALANHITSLLLVPAALVLGSVQRLGGEPASQEKRLPRLGHRYRFSVQALGWQLLWLLAGLSLYLVLPLRALAHPLINWGNPLTLDRLWWVVSGQYYQSVFFRLVTVHVWEQLAVWMKFSLMQMGAIAILVGLLNLILLERLSRLVLLTIWAAATSLLFVYFYHPADAEVYLLPLLISCSIWLGLGTGRLAGGLSRYSPGLSVGFTILVFGIVLLRPSFYFHQVDASQNHEAERFGRQVLSSAPENAILFARGDQALFTLWYFHFALGQRPDVAVLATDLLPYDWYQENLRYAYPSLSLPGEMLFPETIARANSNRPTCRVEYSNGRKVSCTPPLQSP